MIRLAKKEEIPAIMTFIDTYWKKGHILGVNEEMFRYEFETEDGLNIVVSVNEEGDIDGMEGFIPYSHHNKDSMLVIWKVKKTSRPMLGIEILQYIREYTDSRIVASPGINQKTKVIYEYLGLHTGKMNHWYRLSERDHYSIAEINNRTIPNSRIHGKKVQLFSSFEELTNVFEFERYKNSDFKPFREPWYIQKRYFNHPIYKYDVYGVMSDAHCNTLLVFRSQPVGDAIAYRFVDVIGEYSDVYSCTDAIDEIILHLGAEYSDFYEVGMDSKQMEEAGWMLVEGSGNIIPNYFSPFVRENIDIHYCTSDKEIHLFKADGDQDRPN